MFKFDADAHSSSQSSVASIQMPFSLSFEPFGLISQYDYDIVYLYCQYCSSAQYTSSVG